MDLNYLLLANGAKPVCIKSARGMLVFYVERVERKQRLNASGPDGVSSSHHISALIFGSRQRFFNRF